MSELFHSSENYRSLVYKCSDMISILDSNGIYIYVNPAVTSILSFEPEELIGKSSFDFVHPDDLEMTNAAFRNFTAEATFHSPPFRYKSKEGNWIWMDVRASNLLDDPDIKGIVAISREVTELIEAKQQLEENEAQYKSLFLYHPDAVFSLSLDGRFEKINESFTTITGYGPEIIGRHYSDLIHPAFHQEILQVFKNINKNSTARIEGEIQNKSGIPFYMNFTVIPIMLGDVVKGIQIIGKDITQIRDANQKIKVQSEMLSDIFESITQPFFVLDKQWRYVFVNKAFAEEVGQDRLSYIGQCVWELFPESVGSKFQEHCFEVARTGVPAQFDEFIPSHNVILNYNIFQCQEGVTVFFTDVTKQKETELELRKLSLVASKTVNGILILDPKGNLEWVNDSFVNLIGHNREDILGKKPTSLLAGSETNPAVLARIKQHLRSTLPFSEELLLYKKDGTKVWFILDVTPTFDQDTNLTNFICVVKDSTELKKKEEEMEQLSRDLFYQNRDLQQFAYIVSHNMRAPVANILGLTGLLRDSKAKAQFDHALSLLTTSTLQLDKVIKDLNEILSVRDGRHARLNETIRLSEALELVVQSQTEQIDSSGSLVDNLIDPAFETQATKAYVYSIFHNLLSNAIKYRSPERKLHVTVSLENGKDATRILFTDNGVGMNLPDTNGQLFKIYKRFHSHVEGRGIGLYLVKEQAKAMAWKITVDSKPGEGTTFILEISN
ncbi:PAS domain S-box protein [Pontibacter arcticus]|uniref:histidine kinase n=1 Tax=Pontibacter arcticus TaxID=2080288 RepID=A0A364RF00_9BACT|nr:PAS domain S-box protein [Pontibacter arcticus]RAU82881.1 hypothetical protein DP923_06435 [Pontibacter arcticus]